MLRKRKFKCLEFELNLKKKVSWVSCVLKIGKEPIDCNTDEKTEVFPRNRFHLRPAFHLAHTFGI